MPGPLPEQLRKALETAGLGDAYPRMEGLPERYLGHHDESEVLRHAQAVRALSDEQPVAVLRSDRARPADRVACTICSFDSPGLFSYLAGVLGAAGLDVEAGHVFTSARGVAIDSFEGRLDPGIDRASWFRQLEADLTTLLRPLRSSPPDPASVRELVSERVAHHLSISNPGFDRLLPVTIEVQQENELTRVAVSSQDTPFFLYSLATALALQDLSIVAVDITTDADEIRDRFWIRKTNGATLLSPTDIERLRLSILVTKQFTHALDQAADPREAFTRFEDLVRRVALDEGLTPLRELLADPGAQRELARLLGASDFLWEDFIRLQYENLLPMLGREHHRDPLSTPSEELDAKLRDELATAETWDEQVRVLNAFKDRESYLIDADHILRRNTDFFFLSHRLTRLADVVVSNAFSLAWDRLTGAHGEPRSAAGLPASFAVFGLGKMGGSALGYASDIELMMVYSDHGETSGALADGTSAPRGSLSNREFFEKLIRQATDAIHSRREAIFEIDLRLRPYGKDGPLAVHLESFINYFGAAGAAHSAERLALIRLRSVAGDSALGSRVAAIRDQIVYGSDAIDVSEIRALRERQADEKTAGGRLNAKFSPGALVDLEYNVQLMQVDAGRQHPEVRNPGIHATLRTLSELGTIDEDEAETMIAAYRFLRNLINGLRMLRGNAQDLFLPDFEQLEAVHLARRMGYRDTRDYPAARQLRVDFEVQTATVRSFVERHLGQDALPARTTGNPADLVLSDSLSEERISAVLRSAGVRQPSRGIVNIRRMAGSGSQRETFARLMVLAWAELQRSGDPDMALNNWDRFTEQVGNREAFFRELLAQPRRLEVMLTIFAGSQFLSDTLIRTPSFLAWLSDPAVVSGDRSQPEMEQDLRSLLEQAPDRSTQLDELRRFRRREILRIGARDICLHGEFRSVVSEISSLARATVQVALEAAQTRDPRPVGRFCILAFGKLGGGELNYSSDIDLLALYAPDETIAEQESNATRLMRQLVRDLTDFTVEGQAYRVDLRLRPWGNAGRLVYSRPTLERYYGEEAELWELQALLKLSPIAGDRELGWDVLNQLQEPAMRRIEQAGRDAVLQTVRQLRARAVVEHDAMPDEDGSLVGADVKNGEGGIRDIEFMTQALQLFHHRLSPGLLTGNTLAALSRLEEAAVLDAATVRELSRDYLFLRRIEHFLQVYDDQQLHAIPPELEAQTKLTRVVLGDSATPADLLQRLEETLQRVRRRYLSVVSPG